MRKPLSVALIGLLLAGCGQGADSSSLSLDAEELQNFLNWKRSQTKVEVEPFKAKPIVVQGTGTVRAAPDIAVLTGKHVERI